MLMERVEPRKILTLLITDTFADAETGARNLSHSNTSMLLLQIAFYCCMRRHNTRILLLVSGICHDPSSSVEDFLRGFI